MQLSDFTTTTNLVRLFLDRADEQGDAPCLTHKINGEWQSLSWAECARQVCLLAEGLRGLGLKPGDRVALISENRPQWCIADLAIMAAGCVTTPAYITNTERDHEHILSDSGAVAVIVSNQKLAVTVVRAMVRTGAVRHLIGMETVRPSQQGGFQYRDWSDLLQGDAATARAAVETRLDSILRKDLACIIYTSGTGGAPRGVMLSHGALLSNVTGAGELLVSNFGAKEHRFLSFLPLSHAYEHTAGQLLPLALGAEIWYAEGLDKLAANIEQSHPTIIVVVPRLFEILRARIIKQIEKQGKFAQFLLDQAMALSERRAKGQWHPGDWLLERLLERTLRPKIRARFGGRLQALVSGGAPLNPEVGRFFQALGLTMLQGYGQTEAAPLICCNHPQAGIALETVGPPISTVELRIAEDGEILVRGEGVMLGYWRNEPETARALKDGWLHTGDIGHLDAKGRLLITDRKKDMIVNDKGDNVAPQKVEGMLTLQPEIAQAMIFGDRKPYIVGLLVPDAEWAVQWARDNNQKFDCATLQQLPAFRNAMRAAVDRVNQDLSVIEKVRQFVFADAPFTIDNQQLTPSMKIRRHAILEVYRDRIGSLYKE